MVKESIVALSLSGVPTKRATSALHELRKLNYTCTICSAEGRRRDGPHLHILTPLDEATATSRCRPLTEGLTSVVNVSLTSPAAFRTSELVC